MRLIVERCLACEAVANREPSSDNATDRALLYRLPKVRKSVARAVTLVLQTPTRYRA
jgi:hypothetical protein